MKKIKTTQMRRFTLVELMMALLVFSIVMLGLMYTFNGVQNVWRKTNGMARSYENARIILDILANDLEAAEYVANTNGACFYAEDGTLAGKTLWMVVALPDRPNDYASHNVEVFYKLEEASGDDKTDGRGKYILKRAQIPSRTATNGDNTSNWDYLVNTNAYNTPSSPDCSDVADNIYSLNITRYSVYSDDSTSTPQSTKKAAQMPHFIEIKLRVFKDSPEVTARLANGTYNEADTYFFSRVIQLNHGQSYTTAD